VLIVAYRDVRVAGSPPCAISRTGSDSRLTGPRHVFITDPFSEDLATTRITSGPYDHSDIAWSPDGELLAFTAGRRAEHADDVRNDVWICAPDGSGLRYLTDTDLIVGCPRFSSDGTLVCFAGETLDADNNPRAINSYGLWWKPSW
jgi:Tol biopolymer transport system component